MLTNKEFRPQLKIMMSFIFNQLYSFILFVILQLPQNIPSPSNNESMAPDSVFDYILIIGTPIIIAIYFYWKKHRKEKEE